MFSLGPGTGVVLVLNPTFMGGGEKKAGQKYAEVPYEKKRPRRVVVRWDLDLHCWLLCVSVARGSGFWDGPVADSPCRKVFLEPASSGFGLPDPPELPPRALTLISPSSTKPALVRRGGSRGDPSERPRLSPPPMPSFLSSQEASPRERCREGGQRSPRERETCRGSLSCRGAFRRIPGHWGGPVWLGPALQGERPVGPPGGPHGCPPECDGSERLCSPGEGGHSQEPGRLFPRGPVSLHRQHHGPGQLRGGGGWIWPVWASRAGLVPPSLPSAS